MTTARLAIPAALLLGAAGFLAGSAPSANPTPAVTAARADSYTVDRVHSAVLFQIRHVGVSNFYGRFNDFSGSFAFDPDTGTLSDVAFEVKTASVDTGNQKRDDHLRSADFFNARQFDTIEFAGAKVEHTEGNRYTLTGDLTMQGETKTITAELEWLGTGTGTGGGPIGAFEAQFEVKRSDFGMTKYLAPDRSDSGGLGNTVKLIVSVEAGKE